MDRDEPVPSVIISPDRHDALQLLRDVLRARYMFVNLVKTAALAPYTDIVFGYFWTFFRPMVFMSVMVLIKNGSKASLANEMPYPLYVFSGLVMWWYFVDATKQSSKSMFRYKSIITKIYFPRLIIPAIPVVARLFDLMVQAVGLVGMMIYFDMYPGANIVALPFAVLILMALAMAIGFLCSALIPLFRDIERVLDNILYVALFMSPVFYSVSMIPENYRTLYYLLNPAAGPLMALRAALFSDVSCDWTALMLSGSVTMVLLAIGIAAFIKVERTIAERVL